jgi:hypothetical protein
MAQAPETSEVIISCRAPWRPLLYNKLISDKIIPHATTGCLIMAKSSTDMADEQSPLLGDGSSCNETIATIPEPEGGVCQPIYLAEELSNTMALGSVWVGVFFASIGTSFLQITLFEVLH